MSSSPPLLSSPVEVKELEVSKKSSPPPRGWVSLTILLLYLSYFILCAFVWFATSAIERADFPSLDDSLSLSSIHFITHRHFSFPIQCLEGNGINGEHFDFDRREILSAVESAQSAINEWLDTMHNSSTLSFDDQGDPYYHYTAEIKYSSSSRSNWPFLENIGNINITFPSAAAKPHEKEQSDTQILSVLQSLHDALSPLSTAMISSVSLSSSSSPSISPLPIIFITSSHLSSSLSSFLSSSYPSLLNTFLVGDHHIFYIAHPGDLEQRQKENNHQKTMGAEMANVIQFIISHHIPYKQDGIRPHHHGVYHHLPLSSSLPLSPSILLPPLSSIRFSFTLLTEYPDPHYFQWDFNQISQQFLNGFFNDIDDIVTVTTDYQAAQFGHISQITPKKKKIYIHQQEANNETKIEGEEGKDLVRDIFVLTSDDLSNFVGSIGWHLQSPLVKKSFEFVLFVPHHQLTPLYIIPSNHYHNNGNNDDTTLPYDTPLLTSFIVPQWGGIVIFNEANTLIPSPPPSSPPPFGSYITLSPHDVSTVMGIFITQIRTVLGLSNEMIFNDKMIGKKGEEVRKWREMVKEGEGEKNSPYPSLFSSSSNPLPFLLLPPSPPHYLTPWESLSLLSRSLSLHYNSTLSTLENLAFLIESSPHMPSSEVISRMGEMAMEEMKKGGEIIMKGKANGNQWGEANRHIRLGRISSMRAFFDPTMMPQLYFPIEHLYAMFAPMFLPILIPVVGAMIQRVKEAGQRWGEKNGKGKQKGD